MKDAARTFSNAEGDLMIEEGQSPDMMQDVASASHFANLADVLPKDTIDTLASSTVELVNGDADKRGPWETLLATNLDLLGLGPESEPDDVDDNVANTSDHPLMLTAITRFQSKALSALLPSPDRVCETECALDLEAIEDEDQREQMREEADEAGRRVERYMADYLLKRHRSYRPDTDRLLFECGMGGVGLRKVYNDLSRRDQKTRVEQVDVDKLVISFDTKHMTCGRFTELVDMTTPDLIRNIASGTYRAISSLSSTTVHEVGPKEEAENRINAVGDAAPLEGETHRLYEIYLDLVLSADPHPNGQARPYVMTVHAASQEILSLRRNWQEGDLDEEPIEKYVAYIFSPASKGYLGIGLGHILANITRALRTAQRRGLEAGYLQNHPSGFKLSSLKVRDDATKVRSGEFVDVDTPVGDIRSALMLHPFQGPSAGLMQLADKMEQAGRELGGIATIDFSQLMKAGVAAGPAMAAYDESTEFQTAIHSRLYHAHATELRLVMDRMREVHGNNPVPFGVNSVLKPGDLTAVDLVPIMKPGQISRQRQVLEAQAMLDVANQYPDIVDQRRAVEDFVRSLGKPDVSVYILPDPAEAPPPEPADPLSEYAAMVSGEPVRAGMQQNHQAHIDAHAASMRMLQFSQLPVEQGEAVMASIAAHIAEHMGMQMMVEVAQRMGVPLDQLQQLPPEMEAQVADGIAEQIAAIEEERRPADAPAEESKIELEQVKGQNAAQVQSLRSQQAVELERVKARHASELQAQKDAAAMERSVQDDETAVEIAGMKDRNKAPTRAGGLSS